MDHTTEVLGETAAALKRYTDAVDRFDAWCIEEERKAQSHIRPDADATLNTIAQVRIESTKSARRQLRAFLEEG